MKIKLTPLNIVSAIGLVAAVWLLINQNETGRPGHIDMTGWVSGFCFLIFIVAFVSDQIFRKFIPDLKKLWIIEGMMVFLTIILVFILKVSL